MQTSSSMFDDAGNRSHYKPAFPPFLEPPRLMDIVSTYAGDPATQQAGHLEGFKISGN